MDVISLIPNRPRYTILFERTIKRIVLFKDSYYGICNQSSVCQLSNEGDIFKNISTVYSAIEKGLNGLIFTDLSITNNFMIAVFIEYNGLETSKGIKIFVENDNSIFETSNGKYFNIFTYYFNDDGDKFRDIPKFYEWRKKLMFVEDDDLKMLAISPTL